MNQQWIRKQAKREEDRLVIHEKGELQWISFPLLDRQDWLMNAFSTRLGGVSAGCVGSLNLGFSREPDRENVKENYRRLAEAAGFSPDDMVFTDQTHTSRVLRVGEEHRGCGYNRERPYRDVDALITDVPGLVLVVFTADCVPVLLADPGRRAIGVAHSGWRGTVADIGGETVRAMADAFQSDPADIRAAIGPSVCMDCYEVDEAVISQFRDAYPTAVHDRLFYKKPDGKYQLDLWEACRQNLLRAGLLPEHISRPDLCTRCNSTGLYSHRASGGRRGSLAGFLSIRR